MESIVSNNTCNVCVAGAYEFLICGSLCVAVRDRHSGEWLEDHYAVDERVSLVPRSRDAGGMSRWSLQICTFGNMVQVGPLERVERAEQALCLAVAHQLGNRYRVTGPEGDHLKPHRTGSFLGAA